MELGIKTASTFEKVKILGRHIKALGISQAAFELHVSVIPEAVGWTL